MRRLLLEAPFSATHQIVVAGELEPVHGHDFHVSAVVDVDDDRDALVLLPVLRAAVAALQATPLGAVARREGGLPSAERIARYLHRRLGELLVEDTARVHEVAVRESPGCVASYRGER